MKITEVQEYALPRILLVGGSGTGKTHLIGRIHQKLKSYNTDGIRYFDFDGTRTMKARNFDVDIGDRVRPYVDKKGEKGKAFSDFVTDISAYERDQDCFAGIAIDSFTPWQKTCMNYVHSVNKINRHIGTSGIQDYGIFLDVMEQFFVQLMNLSEHSLVIVTMHIKYRDDQVNEDKTEVIPGVKGRNMPGSMGGWFHEVWRTYYNGGYMVQTVPDSTFQFCKTQTPNVPERGKQEQVLEALFQNLPKESLEILSNRKKEVKKAFKTI